MAESTDRPGPSALTDQPQGGSTQSVSRHKDKPKLVRHSSSPQPKDKDKSKKEKTLKTKRSFTASGQHALLPAAHERAPDLGLAMYIAKAPGKTLISWTFGRGTVIWRIWPAVLLHTAFAAIVVSISLTTPFNMSVPSVLLTVLGVVIGFVISYRAATGYDRYWAGRTAWSDVVRNARIMGRWVWTGVPARVRPSPPEGTAEAPDEKARREREALRVMREKHVALDLVEAFAIALKHHLRGEQGVYYEDLYHLVRPLVRASRERAEAEGHHHPHTHTHTHHRGRSSESGSEDEHEHEHDGGGKHGELRSRGGNCDADALDLASPATIRVPVELPREEHLSVLHTEHEVGSPGTVYAVPNGLDHNNTSGAGKSASTIDTDTLESPTTTVNTDASFASNRAEVDPDTSGRSLASMSASNAGLSHASSNPRLSHASSNQRLSHAPSNARLSLGLAFPDPEPDPVIPPITAYGTFNAHGALSRSRSSLLLSHSQSRTSSSDDDDSNNSGYASEGGRHRWASWRRRGRRGGAGESRLLLPASVPHAETMVNRVSKDLIPFEGIWNAVVGVFRRGPRPDDDVEGGVQRHFTLPAQQQAPQLSQTQSQAELTANAHHSHSAGRSRAVSDATRPPTTPTLATTAKKHPRIAGGGTNVPLDLVRCLGEWVTVVEDRGCASGNVVGGMYGCLAAFEDSLAALERILTTPLPFVYSVHIRHTVWIYLFFLPFQLIDLFDWYAIPGTAIAAFIYLGFLAAGEEIEQPFGYDENDLDLDLICREIVHADIERLRRTPGKNVHAAPPHTHERGRKHGSRAVQGQGQEEHELDMSVFGALL